MGDKSDPRPCKMLKAAIVEHNCPSQWHSKFPEGYILLSVNDDKKYFDLAQQTIYGKPVYIFSATKEVERICLLKCAEEKETVETAKVLIYEGRNMYAGGNLWGAVRKYRTAMELDPSNADAHYWLGETLLKLGLYKEALESLSRAESLPSDERRRSQIYDGIRLAKSELGDKTAAIFFFDLSLGFSSRNFKALVHRGMSYDMEGQHDRAYTDALMALKLRPA